MTGVPREHLHLKVGKTGQDVFAANVELAIAALDRNLGNRNCAEFARLPRRPGEHGAPARTAVPESAEPK